MIRINPMLCPRHQQQNPGDKGQDFWQFRGQDMCCSYCGSWHPDEFLDFLEEAADPQKPLLYITHSDKSYKIYVHRPTVSHAGHGAIKFYKYHLPETIDDATQALYREALEVSFRKAIAKVDEVCLDLGMGRGVEMKADERDRES